MPGIDFGYNAGGNGSGAADPDNGDKTDLLNGSKDNGGKDDLDNLPKPQPDPNPNSEPDKDKDDKDKDDKGNKEPVKDKDGDGNQTIDIATLEAGTTIETEDGVLLVDEQGNLVDKDGNIFKTKEEANEYLNQFEQDGDGEEEISIDTIQKTIGVDVVDDKGKKVKFDNTPDGVRAYVNSVIEIRENEIQEAALNRLYQDVPVLPDIINYYIANGNSLEGFNEVPDRSKIVVDENDAAQQKAIIKQAYREFGKRGDVNKYIKYLEDSGQLVDVAKEELAALQKADEDEHKRLAKEAEKKMKADEEESEKYWLGVKKTIEGKKIAGYQIPDNIIIEKDGKKISATPDDFFNYVYQVDDKGHSRYEYDLAKDTPEQRRDDQLLRAYLKFVGGNYASLVDMAIKEKQTVTLRQKANKATAKGVKITPPQTGGTPKAIDFGY